MPSTRALAASLKLARGTVIEAFQQLHAEGFLESQARGGTVVANVNGAAETFALPPQAAPAITLPPGLPPNVARLASVAQMLRPTAGVPFAITHPAGAVAPDEKWRRLGNRVRGMRSAAPSGYIDPRGLFDLRLSISDYVRKARAVKCDPEQIIITAGTQQGLYLAASVMLAAGDAAWAEDPAYPGITSILGAFDVDVHRVPVDAYGIDVESGVASCRHARVAFVTPSHQYPLGMPMSMARRTALLSWARQNNSWIVEDDYDSELRYAGHPFPSLQGLDPSRVIYIGTMSKVLFCSLRVGYLILPRDLVDAFAGAKALMDRHSPSADQHVLTHYMREGHFEAHIRRIRTAYSERRTGLIAAIEQHLPGWTTLQPSDQGMHLVLWLPDVIDDVAFAAKAEQAGLVVRAISPMYSSNPRSGLMLGFGGFSVEELAFATSKLRVLLEEAAEGANQQSLSKPPHLDMVTYEIPPSQRITRAR